MSRLLPRAFGWNYDAHVYKPFNNIQRRGVGICKAYRHNGIYVSYVDS